MEFQKKILEFFCGLWESNSEALRMDDFLYNLLYVKWNLRSEDIAYTYLSLLKRISLGLNSQSVKLLFSTDMTDFQFYNAALKFWKHPDPLNRASCHTILLNIFKYAENELLDYLLETKNSLQYFINTLIKHIKR